MTNRANSAAESGGLVGYVECLCTLPHGPRKEGQQIRGVGVLRAGNAAREDGRVVSETRRNRICRRVKAQRVLGHDAAVIEVQNIDPTSSRSKLQDVIALDPGDIVKQVVVARRTALLQESLNRVGNGLIKHEPIADIKLLAVEEQRRT